MSFARRGKLAIGGFVLAALVACASKNETSGSKTTSEAPADPAPPVDTEETCDVDAADASDASTEVKASVGACASCTVEKCKSELEQCGASDACKLALVQFNTCFEAKKDGTSGDCGPKLAKRG